MAVDVVSQVEISRSRTEVAAYACDPNNALRWYNNIKKVNWESQRPVQVGSKMEFVAQFLGRQITYTYEIRELAAGERLVMKTTDGPFPMETTYSFEDALGGGTRMTLRNRGKPSGFSIIGAPFLARAVRRANKKDLARLKELLETKSMHR